MARTGSFSFSFLTFNRGNRQTVQKARNKRRGLVWTALLAAFLLAVPGTPSSASQRDRLPLQVDNYSLEIPAKPVQGYAVQHSGIRIDYQDGSRLEVAQVSRDSFEVEHVAPSEYLKALLGEKEPSDRILGVLRERMHQRSKDKKIINRDKLTFYLMHYDDREVAFVSDEYEPDYYVRIETRGQPVDPLVATFVRGGATDYLSQS